MQEDEELRRKNIKNEKKQEERGENLEIEKQEKDKSIFNTNLNMS